MTTLIVPCGLNGSTIESKEELTAAFLVPISKLQQQLPRTHHLQQIV
jgi:hypothetical protein